MTILEFALQMEKDGKAYYEILAAEAQHPGLQTIFSQLAEDEQKHYELFEKMINNSDNLDMQDTAALATAQNIFSELLAKKEGFKGTAESLAAYQHAMTLEAESVRLYQQAADEETDLKKKNLLQKIAAEEQKHFNILENIYLFISAAEQYPAWAESGRGDETR